jgi:membrane protease subunit HflC
MTRMFRNPIVLAILGIVLLVLIGSTVVIVPETKQAVVTRFGEPQRIINRYQAGQEFGDYGAGIAFRVPFIDSIEWIDKRILSVAMEDQQVLSTDQFGCRSTLMPGSGSSIRCACTFRRAPNSA